MSQLPVNIGIALARLRTKASMSQAAVAPKVRVDQSRISRIENGEVAPSTTEVHSYLEAVGTEEAQRYLQYLEKDWGVLSPPEPDNPMVRRVRHPDPAVGGDREIPGEVHFPVPQADLPPRSQRSPVRRATAAIPRECTRSRWRRCPA